MKKEKNKIWFRAKEYGWGWYPSTKEGWIVMGVFLLFVFAWSAGFTPKSEENMWIFFAGMAVAVGGLLLVCFATGEKPEWRWGGKPIFRKK